MSKSKAISIKAPTAKTKLALLQRLIARMIDEDLLVKYEHESGSPRYAEVYTADSVTLDMEIPISVHNELRDLIDIEDVRFAVHYVQTPGCLASWVYAAANNTQVLKYVVPEPKYPTWNQTRQNPAYGRAYRKAPRTTKEQARKLRVGDIIEVTYEDTNELSQELVIERTSAKGAYDGISTISKSAWESPGREDRRIRGLNSDKFELIGHVDFLSLLCAAT